MGVGGCGGQTPSTLTSLARGPQEGGFRSAGGSRPVPGLDPPKDDDMTIRGFLRGGGVVCNGSCAPPPSRAQEESVLAYNPLILKKVCLQVQSVVILLCALLGVFFADFVTLLRFFLLFPPFPRLLCFAVVILSNCPFIILNPFLCTLLLISSCPLRGGLGDLKGKR